MEINTATVSTAQIILYPTIFVKANASLPVRFLTVLIPKKNSAKISTKNSNTLIILQLRNVV